MFELTGLGGPCARLQAVVRHDEEEVDTSRDEHECDHRGEEGAVLDLAAVDGQYERVEIGLAERDCDDRIDDIDYQRGDHGTERATDHECHGELNHVALVEKVTKAFHDVLLVPRAGRIPRAMRRPQKG